MKIAFMGKGGSGKTTLTALFVKYLDNYYPENKKIIFDVDINSHLCDELNFIQPSPLGTHFNEIFGLLEPTLVDNFGFDNIPALGTFPITQNSTLIYPEKLSSYGLEKFYSNKGNNYFFQSGNFLDSDNKAHNCYHGMLNSYELLIHHIRDSQNDFVIADTTAGSDNLGTSLYMAYDISFFIVEPTTRSIQVYQDYISTAQSDNIFVIVNKVRSQEDIDFVHTAINEEKIVCYFEFNSGIYKENNGSYEYFITNKKNNFDLIVNKIQSTPKNWGKYYKQLNELYLKEVNGWFSGLHKIDLEKLYLNKNKLGE